MHYKFTMKTVVLGKEAGQLMTLLSLIKSDKIMRLIGYDLEQLILMQESEYIFLVDVIESLVTNRFVQR